MQRPKAATVFGILNIVLAAWGIFGLIVSLVVLRVIHSNPAMAQIQQNPLMEAWTKIASVLGFFAAIFLAIAGIGLLLVKNWGRILSIIYAIYAFVFAVIGFCFTLFLVVLPMIERAQQRSPAELGGAIGGAIGAAIGSLFSLAYPVVLLIFMLRPKFVEAMRAAQQSPAQQPIYPPAA